MSELWHTDLPVCPHCNHIERDAWEIGNGEEGDFMTTCGSCDEDYSVSRHVSVSYSTSPVKEEGT